MTVSDDPCDKRHKHVVDCGKLPERETLDPKWEFPKMRGPQYRPQNTIILITGTPKKVPLIQKECERPTPRKAHCERPKHA